MAKRKRDRNRPRITIKRPNIKPLFEALSEEFGMNDCEGIVAVIQESLAKQLQRKEKLWPDLWNLDKKRSA